VWRDLFVLQVLSGLFLGLLDAVQFLAFDRGGVVAFGNVGLALLQSLDELVRLVYGSQSVYVH